MRARSARDHVAGHKIIRRKLIYNQIFKLPFALWSCGSDSNPFGGRGAKKGRFIAKRSAAEELSNFVCVAELEIHTVLGCERSSKNYYRSRLGFLS
jgi:hypothetical protein